MQRPNGLPSEGFMQLFDNIQKLPKKMLLTSILAIAGLAFAANMQDIPAPKNTSVMANQGLSQSQMRSLHSIQMMEWGSYADMLGLSLNETELSHFIEAFNHSDFEAIANIGIEAEKLSQMAVKQGLYSGSLPSDIRQDLEVHIAGQVVVVSYEEASALYNRILNAMEDPAMRQTSLAQVAHILAAAQLNIDPSEIKQTILPAHYNTLSSNDVSVSKDQLIMSQAVNTLQASQYSLT